MSNVELDVTNEELYTHPYIIRVTRFWFKIRNMPHHSVQKGSHEQTRKDMKNKNKNSVWSKYIEIHWTLLFSAH